MCYPTYMRSASSCRGFTLPELLVTGFVLILLVLGSVLLIHPKDYARQRHDAQRWIDISQLMQALNKYVAQQGQLPADIPAGKAKTIGSQKGEVNMCLDFLGYMKENDVPFDPTSGAIIAAENCSSEGAHYITGYTIVRNKDGSVTIAAPHAEMKNAHISITRKF
jgi:Tfp pilus assembly protein PilE